MNDLKEKERKAIEALRMFEPEDEPYYLCYSGGKDSKAATEQMLSDVQLSF